MSLLKQDTIKKERIDENITELEFGAGNSEEYKVEASRDCAVYTKESEVYLTGLYHLIAWKGYLKEKNT